MGDEQVHKDVTWVEMSIDEADDLQNPGLAMETCDRLRV